MLTLTSPVEIWAHRIPAGLKLGLLCIFTILIFALKTPASLSVALGATGTVIATGGAGFARSSLKMLRPIWPFLVIVGLWNLWLGDLAGGLTTTLRMVTAVAAANFVTMTTRLSDMIAVIQRLAQPFAQLGLSPKALALVVALTIRFIPVMLIRMEQIGDGWRARSARRPGWRILLPVTLAALDDADRVAEALRARGGAG